MDEIRQRGQWKELIGADGVPLTEPDGQPTRVLDARSSGLVAGNFFDPGGAGTPGASDFEMKVYWVPQDTLLARTEPLTVKVTDLHGSLADVDVSFPPGASTTAPGEEPARFFWPSGVPLPESGRWRMTAQAAGVWGCFEFTL